MIIYEGKALTSMAQLGDGELCIEVHEGEAFATTDVTMELTTNLDVVISGKFAYTGATVGTIADGTPHLADKDITSGAVTVLRKAGNDSAAAFDGVLYGYKTGT